MRRIITWAVALLLGAFTAHAQDFPTKPIRLVVPYPPGGPTDVVGRLFASKMTDAFGQPVVVENRTGANGNIAAQMVAKSPADGYTLLLHSSSMVINPMLYKAPGYDPFKEFTPVSLLFDYKLMVVVHPSVPANTLQELVALAKAQPAGLSYASAGGVGAPTHLAVEMFAQVAGIEVTHIPYAGGAPAVNDLLGGHVQFMFNNPTQSLPYIKAGKLRALATTGTQRMPQAADLPTVAELGYPGFDVGTWFAIWAPAGTPAAVVAKLNAAVRKAAMLADVKEQLVMHGLVGIASTAAELDAHQKSEAERWGRVIKAANVKPAD